MNNYYLILFVLCAYLNQNGTQGFSNNECEYSIHGCCADGVTTAEGPNFENCNDSSAINEEKDDNYDLENSDDESVNKKTEANACARSEFGCCDDGHTPASSPHKENCPDYVIDINDPVELNSNNNSQENTITPILREASENTAPCSLSTHECCPDGETRAEGPAFKGCKEDNYVSKNRFAQSNDLNQENCLLPEPNKTCYNYTLKWRYDSKEGRCVQFWFGGCDANENLYDTEEECDGKCVRPNGTAVCRLPLVNPNKKCDKNSTRYYFDIHSSSCKSFAYSGCHGNANNFPSLDECQSQCQIPLLLEQCSSLPEKGPCRGSHERWYFNSKLGACKTFVYGGCLKNQNNHLSESDCINSCVKPKQKAVCLLPKMSGNCEQHLDSWYYDFKEGKCKKMVYTGCNGNLNRFESEEACEYTCQGLYAPEKVSQFVEEVCHAPKIAGKCRAQTERWYFNKTTQMCHQFTYSGCDANSNNFESEQSCRSTCNAKEVDPCVLPLDNGSCDNYKVFWYFNRATKECDRFYYGGCDGNQNRFENKENCELACKFSQEEKSALLKLPKQCIQALDYGTNCDEPAQKWYFDIDMKLCYPFEFTGCAAQNNFLNRFDSANECTQLCMENYEKHFKTLNNLEIIDQTTAQAVANQDNAIEKNQRPTNKHHYTAKPTQFQDFDICTLPMERGNCSQKLHKWYYDSSARYCAQFEFTGCHGNDNRFETRHQCVDICELPKRKEICNSNKSQGPCSSFEQRYYFDIGTKMCKEFQYGGCLGNNNNFASLYECSNYCWEYLSDEARALSLSPSSRRTTAALYSSTGSSNRPNSTPLLSNYPDASAEDEDPCESRPEIFTDCLDPITRRILAHKQHENTKTHSKFVWFFDMEDGKCRHISEECISLDSLNRFDTKNECNSMCISNESENPIQGGHSCPDLKDCDKQCSYGRAKSQSDCEVCECYDPCEDFECESMHETCTIDANSKPICKSKHKPGACPEKESLHNSSCEYRTCNWDLDCPSNQKCCPNSCSNLHCTSLSLEKDPVIEELMDDIQARRGENLVLRCKTSGFPKPKITWLKNHDELSFDLFDTRMLMDENNSLMIQNVSSQDEGVYTCKAENKYGKSDSKDSNVFVLEDVEIKISPESPVFTVGQNSAQLKCLTEPHVVIHQIDWFKNGQKLELVRNKKYVLNKTRLDILHVEMSDAGNYTCRIATTQKQELSKTVHLKVVEENNSHSNKTRLDCEDASSHAHCKLVVIRGLCEKWGKFCCKSCRQAGYKIHF